MDASSCVWPRLYEDKVCVKGIVMSPANEESVSASSSGANPAESVPSPSDALIIIPVRNTVLFPGVVAPITIGRPKSIAAAQQALREQRPVGIVLQRNPETNDPAPD